MDAREARTSGLSVSGQALYHRVTALPYLGVLGYNFKIDYILFSEDLFYLYKWCLDPDEMQHYYLHCLHKNPLRGFQSTKG